ncbi:porin [Variovorax paradoxus]|uniref:porin n=1 Tax=Variovorax paradoxus TaxID=34073 RepID=UPI00247FB37D|nr:porin [Variovorax paradoxus]WGT62264.1 porin [Variovorax paradoxus]
MKKSLVALAALAVAGVASAQSSVTLSSVTLFGVVDASISGYSSTSRDLNPTVFRCGRRVDQRLLVHLA